MIHNMCQVVTIPQRQMLQWITALQRVASRCHYTHMHRYGSFAPIRSDVAAQWLVDGVRPQYFYSWSTQRMVSEITSGICRRPSCLPRNPYISMIGGYLRVGACPFIILLPIHLMNSNEPIELQMRRPNKDRYCLGNLLQRKAREGVKIYVIL